MMETEKGKRMDQILATGVTREELAEALWCAESSVRMWNECADALRNENAKLRELSKYAVLCTSGDLRCRNCPYHGKDGEYMTCRILFAAIELGIEVFE